MKCKDVTEIRFCINRKITWNLRNLSLLQSFSLTLKINHQSFWISNKWEVSEWVREWVSGKLDREWITMLTWYAIYESMDLWVRGQTVCLLYFWFIKITVAERLFVGFFFYLKIFIKEIAKDIIIYNNTYTKWMF